MRVVRKNRMQRNFGQGAFNQVLMLVRTLHEYPTWHPRLMLMHRVTQLRGLLQSCVEWLRARANLAITCVAQTYATKVPLAKRVSVV